MEALDLTVDHPEVVQEAVLEVCQTAHAQEVAQNPTTAVVVQEAAQTIQETALIQMHQTAHAQEAAQSPTTVVVAQEVDQRQITAEVDLEVAQNPITVVVDPEVVQIIRNTAQNRTPQTVREVRLLKYQNREAPRKNQLKFRAKNDECFQILIQMASKSK